MSGLVGEARAGGSSPALAYDALERLALARLVRELNTQGHNPATSGNYSTRATEYKNAAWVSESGIDKSFFEDRHFIPLNIHTAQPVQPEDVGRKSSDETGLHLAIYRATNGQCVLHSHILESLLFADLYPGQREIVVSGLELLKGFCGIKTHEAEVVIPVVDNTQDIESLSSEIESILRADSRPIYGFLLRHHGLYTWGESVKGAKRHLEVFTYLFRYHIFSQRMFRD